ncbi:outer membrane lipid asymmetry maintenance protein MlaD [Halothiobacillus diazotrophicus]|uniref:Outer membrane lipid asymmetry maintenance protein MlaD n=1 Tax=Halothiobacillus diazotrophicus TaxID=1860122 RepID=A0A191ZE66_9GAMM|nr:outer membrane lipid asymmetry maintenance protein MlaD [Halothiobacillus diazotrophicus]ANJ66166.1 outer membrane lipid asymmetry maintenance protein MlaD [Halothiobacillus diazotrophicus]
MNTQRGIEIVVGAFVLAGIVAMLLLTLKWSNFGSTSIHGYTLTAEFDNVGGLTDRSPVKLAGMTIGRVERITVDPKTFEAVVTMVIGNQYNNLPKDSFASIYTAGLLGAQYIEISPGGDTKVLKNGDRIAMTQSAVILEKVISKFLFNKAAEK